MATLTPEEVLGVLKKNNTQSLTQISAIFIANSSPAPTGAQPSGNGVTGDQEVDDAWDDEDGGDPTWEDVLPTRGRETRRDGGGSAVANRLANPPPSQPSTKFSEITSPTPPFHKQQHHVGTEGTASYTACKERSRLPFHS